MRSDREWLQAREGRGPRTRRQEVSTQLAGEQRVGPDHLGAKGAGKEVVRIRLGREGRLSPGWRPRGTQSTRLRRRGTLSASFRILLSAGSREPVPERSGFAPEMEPR